MSALAGLEDWRAEVDSARSRLAGHATRTPAVQSQSLSRGLLFKAENLQVSGSFKFRPAFNSIAANLDAARKCGVVAASSGNFALGVAVAAEQLGVKATLVMMPSASAFKRGNVLERGARVVDCLDLYSARQEKVDEVMASTGALELSPHSFRETIAGGATVGVEILEDVPDVKRILVPTSGGGLLAGISIAVALAGASVEVVGVQSEGNPAFAVSLASGERHTMDPAQTIADGLVATIPGDLPFEIAKRWVTGVVTVPDIEIIAALRLLAMEESLVVEPSGAAAVAAYRTLPRFSDRSVPTVCVLTGGNMAVGDWQRLIR